MKDHTKNHMNPPAKKIIKKQSPQSNRNPLLIPASIAGALLASLLLAWLGISFFFRTHFLINTTINGHDFSARTKADAEEYFRSQAEDYVLHIIEKNEETDVISGKDIALAYREGQGIDDILNRQNIFSWPATFFVKNPKDILLELQYNEAKLEQAIQSLAAVTEQRIPSRPAYVEFDGNQFVVRAETYGTAVDQILLKEKIISAVTQLSPELDLEKEKCYAAPRYTSDSPELQKACEEMNRYCDASITYLMDEPVVIGRETIASWLSTDEEMHVNLDENAVKKWLGEFGDRYDTQGAARTFVTPAGKTATVSGGTYGWSIEEDKEFEEILRAVKKGETVTKEPACYIGGTAASHSIPDWGDTYAEVDLSEQYMWYVSNGTVALETDIVSGQPIPEKITPEGVYSILDKKLNEILVGEIDPATGNPEYQTEVTYWMRVTWEGVGFHDAAWQTAFGGSLNQIEGIGSHGCINMPLYQAAALYEMIEVGTPVIIHY